MYYAETYHKLASIYSSEDESVNNFEIVLATIEKRFGDLFKLDILNSVAGIEPRGSYSDLFHQCMITLKGLHTEEEVADKLSDALASGPIYNMILNTYIFLPDVEGMPTPQIGLLEKLARGQFQANEPLTYLDMVRLVHQFEQANLARGHKYTVVNSHNLKSKHLRNEAGRSVYNTLFINFNKNPRGCPLWAVVDFDLPIGQPTVYCEAVLKEDERRSIEQIFGLRNVKYEGNIASPSVSTGFTALAWYNTRPNQTRRGALTLASDYLALLIESIWIITQNRCRPLQQELNSVVPEFQQSSDIWQDARACILGRVGNEPEYAPGNLTEGFKALRRVKASNPNSSVIIDAQKYANERSFVLGLDAALLHLPAGGGKTVLHETEDTVSLTIPNQISLAELTTSYITHTRNYVVHTGFLDLLKRNKQRENESITQQDQADLATGFVISMLRARAKKRVLEITLPNCLQYQLLPQEQDFIIKIMKQNAFVSEFKNIAHNLSLERFHEELIPTFARNRWLHSNGYKPPMVDNYWKQAAKYWVNYLPEHRDVLLPKEENEFFKRCVLEMGLEGLRAILDYLNDDNLDKERILRNYGKTHPPFYAACRPGEIDKYLRMLINHLQLGAFFPFSELGISYQPHHDANFIDLLGEINQLERFEKITLTDCLANKKVFGHFLYQLIERAAHDQWVGLIVIPELDKEDNLDDASRGLRLAYTQLNNVILRNRHQLISKKLLNTIKETSQFVDEDAPPILPGAGGVHVQPEALGEHVLFEAMQQALNKFSPAGYPLVKGGDVQLQLQQQQQIEQSRQIQQKQQTVRTHVLEEALGSELVDYRNIDRLLGGYLEKYRRENLMYDTCTTLRRAGASWLQNFFHTCVNANPDVEAPQAIFKMTQDAAKALIRKHRALASGLNPENLPKGFYTQRSKDNHLVLCFNAELGEVNPANPFTMDLDVRVPVAEAWKGDFRQLNLDKYLQGLPKIDAEDWRNIVLFAQLQPPKNYTADCRAWCQQHPDWVREFNLNSSNNQERMIRYWPIFLHAWQYSGEDGVREFFKHSDASMTMTASEAREQLLSTQPDYVREWARAMDMDDDYVRALGQIFYRHGDEGVKLFLTKLHQIQVSLGEDFFVHFNEHAIKPSANFNCFMSETFFTTMDNMIAKLRPVNAREKRILWQQVYFKHMQAIQWENIEKLWQGFEHFLEQMDSQGVQLKEHWFAEIAPENMLVCLDRIAESLKCIPSQEQKQHFMDNLTRWDRTHGGVHYPLWYEKFKYFDNDLILTNFAESTPTSPTYAPNIKELRSWSGPVAALKIKRTLASQARFSHQNYLMLMNRLGNENPLSKHQLLWLLHTQYSPEHVEETLNRLAELPAANQEIFATHLFFAVYEHGNYQLAVHFDSLLALHTLAQTAPDLQITDSLMLRYPRGTFVESMSILWQSGRWDFARDLANLCSENINKPKNCPDFLYQDGYKLAALFGIFSAKELTDFYTMVDGVLPIVQNEIRLLITQLLSINYEESDIAALVNPENWKKLLQCIDEMKKNPAKPGRIRIAFIEDLTAQGTGIVLRYSKKGEFRALRDKETEGPDDLKAFVDHEDRLWAFLKNHIAIPANSSNPKEELQPIIRFLKVLQLNRTYLNEVEPLLAILEKTKKETYWSASYFMGLLQALQPEGEQSSFPISLLKVMLQKELIAAKDIDTLEKTFPEDFAQSLQNILKNTVFDRPQQSILCQMALREFSENGSCELVNRIIGVLGSQDYAKSRGYVLDALLTCENNTDLERQFENCRELLRNTSTRPEVASHWTRTSILWLKALAAEKNETTLFNSIRTGFISDPDKQALIYHIVAWSSLEPGLRHADAYEYELDKKSTKLVRQLGNMSNDDLQILAQCYPKLPSPGADDILRILKKSKKQGKPWGECLDEFLCNPYPESRSDFGRVALTREADLQRMIASTQVSLGEERTNVSVENAVRLTLIFSYLKQLERGEKRIHGVSIPISKMSQQEIAEAFYRLSHESNVHPNDDSLRTQIWALMFEALGRTTRKYPHMAQQFALIANDICVTTPTRVLQLATGEGKSHYVAMRAARHAGQGKIVDICTAKRTLAKRDLEDYEGLFHYLELKAAYIHPKSNADDYLRSEIHYSTMGDLSLFLDEQSNKGEPIDIPREHRVGLFDEFDFIRFEEGCKTEYNYARPTSKTPKQMTWFYQTVNRFYKTSGLSKPTAEERPISMKIIQDFMHNLIEEASENEEKQRLIRNLLNDPLQLVQWLQSAHEAHQLVWSKHFTVREENISVGEGETYPMREIIPLSSDSQRMVGSTFSAGVHQLLAVRLNTKAKKRNESQNFHIHPESDILSSQVAAQRMKSLFANWEGFSGTISAAQAATLHAEHETEVLHVPTNQRDRRIWHKPTFYKDLKEGGTIIKPAAQIRYEKMVKQVRICFEKKQSILFACKDDLQVKELERVLQDHFTEEEYKHFIVYTNEDLRAPEDILKEKSKQEQWHGGKKHQAIGLVASGFGRGDNVGVEAVFLLDVSDNNDALQKGGRTARNGEEGEVFQFYLADDIAEELQLYLAELRAIEAMGHEQPLDGKTAIEMKLDKVTGDTVADKQFKQLMLLREHVFSLRNAAKQGYHNAIAQLSTWGLRLLGEVDSTTSARPELGRAFSQTLKKLEKHWLNISSDHHLSVEQKIEAVENAVLEESIEFKELYGETLTALGIAVGEIPEFHLDMRRRVDIKLVVNEPAKPSELYRDIAAICAVLARLPDVANETNIAEIPKMLAKLAGSDRNGDDVSSSSSEGGEEFYEPLEEAAPDFDDAFYAKEIKKFATIAASSQSTKEFTDKLELALANLKGSSLPWEIAHQAVFWPIQYKHLLVDVEDELIIALEQAHLHFHSPLWTQIIESLCAPSAIKASTRIKQALPIINHLASKFSLAEQRAWGLEYVTHMEKLMTDSPREELDIRLQHSSAMSFDQFDSLWTLARHRNTPKDELPEMLKLLGEATKRSPEQRFRFITKWEGWANDVAKDSKARQFFRAFLTVMSQFEEGVNWDTFTTLVKKTQEWWNKGDDGAYQRELMALWQTLAEHARSLPQLDGFLKGLMAQFDKSKSQWLSGKSWFQIMTRIFSLPIKLLTVHQKQIYLLCQDIYKQDRNTEEHLSKKEKNEVLAHRIQDLQWFYQYVEQVLPLQQVVCQRTLLNLDGERFNRMLTMIHGQHDLFMAYPNLFLFLLQHVSDPDVSLTRVETWYELMKQLVHYKNANPSCSIDHLIHPDAIQRIMQLENAPRFDLIMTKLSAETQKYVSHPRVFEKLLNYVEDDSISFEQVTRLSHVLSHVVDYQTTHPESQIEDLLSNLDDFKTKEAALTVLEDCLQKNPSHVAELLADNVAAYLARYVPNAGVRAEMLQAVSQFYQAVIETKGNPADMMKKPGIRELFDFNKPRTTKNELAYRRMMLMGLLHEKVLVKAGAGGHAWSDEDNESMLKLGFEKYIQHTQTVLDEPDVGAKQKQKSGRDLTVKQQHALLQLTDEMAMIGKPGGTPLYGQARPNAEFASADKVTALGLELTSLAKQYQSRWFKSSTRKKQIVELQATIDSALQNSGSTMSHYETVLAALHHAKCVAINRDLEINKERTGWFRGLFKFNRSGSRYYQTLNKMEDMVLRHWGADHKGIHHVQVYQERNKLQFKDVAKSLHQALLQHWQEVNPRNNKQNGTGFWGKKERLELKGIKELEMLLQQFGSSIGIRTGGRNSFLVMKSEDVQKLVDKLEASKKILPGYLATLAEELLARGKSMSLHLKEQEASPSKRSSLGGAQLNHSAL